MGAATILRQSDIHIHTSELETAETGHNPARYNAGKVCDRGAVGASTGAMAAHVGP